jgi:peroxiredoxin
VSSGPGPGEPGAADQGPGVPGPAPEGTDDRSGPPEEDLLSRLDPDRGRQSRPDPDRGLQSRPDPDRGLQIDADGPPEKRRPERVTLAGPETVDTRRYRWMIGIIGLVLVAIFSVYQFATHGIAHTGVAPGQRLRYFAAPLASTTLTGAPNLSPPCTVARHDPRALNICLLARRGPLVLAFFVTDSAQCERQVTALQQLAGRFTRSGVQFAAVAVNADRASTRRAIRAHGWTIPVAYDEGGAVGGLYGVAVCPMVELASRGGIVRDRLIGDRWATSQALAPRVRALVSSTASGP